MQALEQTAETALKQALATSDCSDLLVAFSGGRDSSALLTFVAEWAHAHGIPVRALHVDHALQPQSADWATQCVAIAAALDVACVVQRVSVSPPPGDSLEAWARDERYRLLRAAMTPATCLLTAHHADDQAETVLHRVLRGAGPQGLGGMRALRRLEPGWHARPLLDCSGAAVAGFCRRRGLRWLDDPSNCDRRHLRNRLRHDVLPDLEAAYPGAAQGLRQLARIQAQLAAELERQCSTLLDQQPPPSYRLSLTAFTDVSPALLPYLLAGAIRRAGLAPAGAAPLRALLRHLDSDRPPPHFVVSWGNCQVRCYRQHLYFMRKPAPPPTGRLSWDGSSALLLPDGRLGLEPVAGPGLRPAALAGRRLTVTWRRGGERCHQAGHPHSHSLKKLLQEWGVPPWERDRLPLLMVDDKLAAVAGYCVCAGYAAATDAVALRWDSTLYDVPQR